MQEKYRDATGASATHCADRIQQAIDFAIEEHNEDFMKDDWNPFDGYRTWLWSFSRAIRSCYRSNPDPQDVFWDHIHPEIERRGGWKAVLDVYESPEIVCMEFMCNWDAVRYRIGESPLGNAIEKADRTPLRPERCSRHPGKMPIYGRFISIAGWLQVSMGNRPILLPVEKLGEILGVTAKSVSRYREWAVKDGFLRVCKEHDRHEAHATEFLFDVSQFACLAEAAQEGTQDRFEGVVGRVEPLWWDRRQMSKLPDSLARDAEE